MTEAVATLIFLSFHHLFCSDLSPSTALMLRMKQPTRRALSKGSAL